MAARLSSAQPECVDQSTTDNLSALLTELESGMSLEKVVTEENADTSPSKSEVDNMSTNSCHPDILNHRRLPSFRYVNPI